MHQEDCCQALAVMPERKYQSDGGPGPGDLFDLLLSLIPGGKGDEACLQLMDALAFTWLTGGSDAHAKNFSLLLAGPSVRLSPLYDLTSILPYRLRPGEKLRPGRIRGNPKMAMKIGRDYGVGMVTRDDWVSVARRAGLDPDRVLGRISTVSDLVVPALRAATEEAEVAHLGSTMPKRLLERVEGNVSRCQSALAGRPARSRSAPPRPS